MYTKKSGRVTFRSNRRSNYKRNNNFSNGKARSKGNITQQYYKYLKLAKEASSSGDRIQAEYYYQFTDHYSRLIIELGITLEENEISFEEKTTDTTNKIKEQDISNSENDNGTQNAKETETAETETEENDDRESIQSIPFISDPIKKKSTKLKKKNI